jgi:FkbM family methyltransferase
MSRDISAASRVVYSQHDEETKILEYFGGYVGRFLDVGAYDGVTFSNTWKLVLNGWSGVAVEACPMLIEPLLMNLRGRDVRVVNAALGITRSLVSFKTSGQSCAATMVEANVKKWEKELTFTEIFIAPITWETLLQTFYPSFHFVSIDCEGMSEDLAIDLITRVPVDNLGVRAICIEKDPGDHVRLIDLLHGVWKFTPYHETAENVIYVR